MFHESYGDPHELTLLNGRAVVATTDWWFKSSFEYVIELEDYMEIHMIELVDHMEIHTMESGSGITGMCC